MERIIPVISGRRITLPRDWCKQYHVEDGSAVVVREMSDTSLSVEPIEGFVTKSGRKIIY